jgi:hypothetical protein
MKLLEPGQKSGIFLKKSGLSMVFYTGVKNFQIIPQNPVQKH